MTEVLRTTTFHDLPLTEHDTRSITERYDHKKHHYANNAKTNTSTVWARKHRTYAEQYTNRLSPTCQSFLMRV